MLEEPVYKFHLPERQYGATKAFAAVIEFESEDAERIQQFLDRLHERGITANRAVVKTFDPHFTSPELYFP